MGNDFFDLLRHLLFCLRLRACLQKSLFCHGTSALLLIDYLIYTLNLFQVKVNAP
jgi:hypothetical protein